MRKPRKSVPCAYVHAAEALARSVLDLRWDHPITEADLHRAAIVAVGHRADLEMVQRGWKDDATSQLNRLSNLAGLRERNAEGWLPFHDAIRAGEKALEVDPRVGDYREAVSLACRLLHGKLEADLRAHRAWRERTWEIGLMLRTLVARTGMTGPTTTKMGELADEMIGRWGRG